MLTHKNTVLLSLLTLLFCAPSLDLTAQDNHSNQRESSASYVDKGRSFFGAGEYQLAEQAFDNSLRVDPKNLSAWYWRGRVRLENSSYLKAIDDFSEAIRLNPENFFHFDTYGNRGRAWLLLEKYDLAISDFDKALSIHPTYGDAYRLRGTAWLQKGKYGKAIADFDEALKLDPKDESSTFNRGNARFKKGDIDGAISDFRELVKINPNDAFAKKSLDFYIQEKIKVQARLIADLTHQSKRPSQEDRVEVSQGSTDKVKILEIRKQPRLALLIGNSNYQTSPLANPVNDVRGMAEALRTAGFNVIKHENLNFRQMREAVRDFGEKLSKDHVGLFYYSGHGVQIDGKNYLIPVNSDIKYEDEVASSAIDAEMVLAKLESAKNKLNIVVLDACRDSPLGRRTRTSTKGLSNMNAASGTMIAFSTAPGQVALDGKGSNSPYTKHLINAIKKEG